MTKIDLFAIKVVLGSWFLSAAIIILVSAISVNISATVAKSIYFSGILALIATFGSVYFATKFLLKNSKLEKGEVQKALSRTWLFYLISAGILFLLSVGQTLQRGAVFTIFSLLTFLAAYTALRLVREKHA